MKINSLLKQDSLMKDLGLTDFDNNQQSELFELMMDILEVKILDAVLSALNESEKKEFTLVLLSENVDEARNYLQSRIKNLDTKLDDVVKEFKRELMEDIVDAKKQLLKKGVK